ncbi:MAG TPA: glycosyl hydrolase [Parvularcula sp.]|nr:glycosyl hydrolase [Parvularcula sp.]HBS31772.1 glycosyl hydrolase [Parvularcula sp.]
MKQLFRNSCLFAAIVLAAGCAAIRLSPAGSATNAEVWLTKADGSVRLERQEDLPLSKGAAGDIYIDAGKRRQEIVGFGAAITDASAILIQTKLSPAARDGLIAELFGPSPGLNFSFTRFPIGASDFSPAHYSLDDRPDGSGGGSSRFSLDPAREYLIPTLRKALDANPHLTIMASPWSAPGWMKTSGALIKGTMRDDAFGDFAAYLRLTVDGFADEGVPVHYISIQNEPDFEPANYPGMRLSAGQRARLIGDHVGPALATARGRTKILEWDHNWDQPSQPMAVLTDSEAARYTAGVAWHCYGGDVSVQSEVRALFPDKDVFFTECSSGGWSAPWPDSFLWIMRNIVIGAANNWSRGALMWNLALDETSGPHLGGCGNCRGVVTIDGKTGAVTRNPEYYALAHASRFVVKGARWISSSCPASLSCAAFRNPDGARVLIVLNESEREARFRVRENGRGFDYALAPAAASTFVWR